MNMQNILQATVFIPVYLLSAGMLTVAIVLHLEEVFPYKEGESKTAFFVWLWAAIALIGLLFISAFL